MKCFKAKTDVLLFFFFCLTFFVHLCPPAIMSSQFPAFSSIPNAFSCVSYFLKFMHTSILFCPYAYLVNKTTHKSFYLNGKYLSDKCSFFCFIIFISFYRPFPRKLLHHDSDQAPSWSPSIPPLYLQRAGHPATGHWTWTLTCFSVWGPEWQTSTRGLPTFQRHQPGWWQVSNQQQPVCDWCRLWLWSCGSLEVVILCMFVKNIYDLGDILLFMVEVIICMFACVSFYLSLGGIVLLSLFPRKMWHCCWTARRRWPVLCPVAITLWLTPMV